MMKSKWFSCEHCGHDPKPRRANRVEPNDYRSLLRLCRLWVGVFLIFVAGFYFAVNGA